VEQRGLIGYLGQRKSGTERSNTVVCQVVMRMTAYGAPLGRRRDDRISGGILKMVVPAALHLLLRRLPEKR